MSPSIALRHPSVCKLSNCLSWYSSILIHANLYRIIVSSSFFSLCIVRRVMTRYGKFIYTMVAATTVMETLYDEYSLMTLPPITKCWISEVPS
jgi:hypothetical protein